MMPNFSNLSREQLRSLRKAFEREGSSGATNPVHDQLNRAYSAKFSDKELWDARVSRKTNDEETTQIDNELLRRGFRIPDSD